MDVFTLTGRIAIDWSEAEAGLLVLSAQAGRTTSALLLVETGLEQLGAAGSAFWQNCLTQWSRLQTGVTTVLAALCATVEAGWSSITSRVSSAMVSLGTTVTSGMTTVLGAVKNPLVQVQQEFSSIFGQVQTTVEKAVQAVRKTMDFTWSLPSLKLPHISISGGFSLNPVSVPTFSISWYKKAMDQALLLDSATIFGMNPATGQLLGGGEAGSETIVGTETLMGMIAHASGGEAVVAAVEEGFDRLLRVLEEYLPGVSNARIYLDKKVLVGELAPELDVTLGKLANGRV